MTSTVLHCVALGVTVCSAVEKGGGAQGRGPTVGTDSQPEPED